MIKERVIQVLEYKNIAKESFYIKIGITSANFRGKAKKTPLNSNTIENILSEIPDLNPEWLLTGRGEMLNNESIELGNTYNDKKIIELLEENRQLLKENSELKDKVRLLEQQLEDLGKDQSQRKTAG
jgi:hypothetical protein